MAVPGYHEFMLPLLTLTGDGQEHSLVEVVETLAEQFELSEQDRSIMLSSGQTRLYNRVAWAITYLAKGLLLEKTGRGRFRITQRGREVLSQQPAAIDNAFLGQFEEFVAFKQKSNKNDTDLDQVVPSTPEKEVTPDERMDEAYRELREALADDLLTRVRSGSPKFFEHLVVDVLVAMGYGGSRTDAAQVVGMSGDDGIDGVI